MSAVTDSLVESLLQEVLDKKKIFNAEYDDRETFRDLRWETVLEGTFVSQLERLTHQVTSEQITSDQIGEYVMAFFIARIDEEKFNA
ncbi:hypothetical protein [Sporosarcina sp. FSL K6-5500]|uniref:hypothetical protein n=1 Tax=Sporosarcina sp. FSL K6-5500 TaxID=2921558 RepID=UPI0030F7827B